MNTQQVVLTIDVGLTNCKVSLFNYAGQLLVQTAHRYPTLCSQPGWSEQDPKDWWYAIKQAVKALLQDAAEATTTISVIAVTAHMHGVVAVDEVGRPLSNCITLFDKRADQTAKKLQSQLGLESIYSLTGARLEAYTPAAKIAWLKRHQPELFATTRYFISPKDMVRIQLGGDIVTDHIDAAGTLLYNLQTETWATELLSAIGIPSAKLPPICASTAVGGTLSESAASALGLPAGIPIVVGAGDDIEALGAGVTDPGQTLEHIGTTGTVLTCIEKPTFDPRQRIEVYPYVMPDRYLLGGATNAAGRSLDWARNLFFDTENAKGDLELVYPLPPDSRESPIYLPFIKGERGLLWDDHATGIFFGIREVHNKTDFARAVYEGVALSLKEILVANHELGAAPTAIVSGTPATNEAWTKLRADVYGYPLSFPNSPYPTGLGAAMLALVSQEVYPNIASAVQVCCEISQRVQPNSDRQNYYERKFRMYHATIEASRPLFSEQRSRHKS